MPNTYNEQGDIVSGEVQGEHIKDAATGRTYQIMRLWDHRMIKIPDTGRACGYRYIRHPEEWPNCFGTMEFRNGMVTRKLELNKPGVNLERR